MNVARAELYGVDEELRSSVFENARKTPAPDAPYEKIFEKVRLLEYFSRWHTVDPESDRRDGYFTIAGVEFDKSLAMRQGGEKGNPDGDDVANFFQRGPVSAVSILKISTSITGNVEELAKCCLCGAGSEASSVLSGGKIGAILASDLSYNFKQGAETREAMRQTLWDRKAALLLDGPSRRHHRARIVNSATIESFRVARHRFLRRPWPMALKDDDAPAS